MRLQHGIAAARQPQSLPPLERLAEQIEQPAVEPLQLGVRLGVESDRLREQQLRDAGLSQQRPET